MSKLTNSDISLLSMIGATPVNTEKAPVALSDLPAEARNFLLVCRKIYEDTFWKKSFDDLTKGNITPQAYKIIVSGLFKKYS